VSAVLKFVIFFNFRTVTFPTVYYEQKHSLSCCGPIDFTRRPVCALRMRFQDPTTFVGKEESQLDAIITIY